MLDVTVPPSELEKIFEVLDEDNTGMVEYDQLKTFMKICKIPGTILSKMKFNNPRTSLYFRSSGRSPKQTPAGVSCQNNSSRTRVCMAWRSASRSRTRARWTRAASR